MEIRLKNIGIVKDSSVALDGLTIITGANNSGKSTIGKALYSVLEGAKDAYNAYDKEMLLLFADKFLNISQELDNLTFSVAPSELEQEFVSCVYKFEPFFNYAKAKNYPQCREITLAVIDKLKNLLSHKDIPKASGGIPTRLNRMGGGGTPPLVRKIRKIIELLTELEQYLYRGFNIGDYVKERIVRFLTHEFKGQIQYEPDKSKSASIELRNNQDYSFSVNLQNNTLNQQDDKFQGIPYDKVYLVDNPYIIGTIKNKREPEQTISSLTPQNYRTSNYFDSIKIEEHTQQSLKSINSALLKSSFEDTVFKEKYAKALNILNQVVPGELTFKEGGDKDLYYFHHGEYLNASNLATGMKSFAIIKLLLRQQCLDSDTMLILDEPESHLHPEWQNLYAEMIALLVKEHHVNILLTTHSANFVLALEAYMYKYQLGDITNFYRTSKCNERQVQYELVKEISFIYDDLIEHFAKAKMLRDEYAESYPLSWVMTLEEYAKENWAEYLKPISELSRSKKMDDKSAIVSLETRAYDFDAIVKDKFQSTDYTTPKSADCMLIQGNQICFIEFKRFPCPKKKFEITLPDGVDLPEQLCSDIVESNTTTKSQNRQIKKLTNRDIHNSLKLKIVDSQVLALHDFVQLLQESVPADLSAIFIIVVDNASEDFMVNFLL